MKTIRSFLTIGALAALILTPVLLPACKDSAQLASTTTTTANTVSAGVSALPPALVAKVKALAVKYPTSAKYLDATARALNVAATTFNKLPDPATLDTFLLWTKFDPQISGYAAEFESIYAEAYPALNASAGALTQLAAVVQTSK